MTILLYDYRQLEEKAARQLKAWKVWHLTIYVLAATFGVLNYLMLYQTMELVDNNCVLYPRQLAFKTIDLPGLNDDNTNLTISTLNNGTAQIAHEGSIDSTNSTINDEKDKGEENQVTVLDTTRSLFGTDSDCQYAEYIPILSFIFAVIWATMFTMCPGGGHSRSGLQESWSILAPALIFSIVMVALTGYSFTSTNKGIYDFCAAFYNVTNSTACSSVEPHVEGSWNRSWGFGGRAAAARATSAGTWATWACAFALFMARCLVAPDFKVKRTGAYLNDPAKKLTPYLKKTRRQQTVSSPSRRDNTSIRSEPTATTEVVTVSIEQGQETAPSSFQNTPAKTAPNEVIEMATTPHNGYIWQ